MATDNSSPDNTVYPDATGSVNFVSEPGPDNPNARPKGIMTAVQAAPLIKKIVG